MKRELPNRDMIVFYGCSFLMLAMLIWSVASLWRLPGQSRQWRLRMDEINKIAFMESRLDDLKSMNMELDRPFDLDVLLSKYPESGKPYVSRNVLLDGGGVRLVATELRFDAVSFEAGIEPLLQLDALSSRMVDITTIAEGPAGNGSLMTRILSLETME